MLQAPADPKSCSLFMRLEVLTATKRHIAVLWLMTPCSLALLKNSEYVQRYETTCSGTPALWDTGTAPCRQKATVESPASFALGWMSREAAIETLGQIQQSLIISSPPTPHPLVSRQTTVVAVLMGGQKWGRGLYTPSKIRPCDRQSGMGRGWQEESHLDIIHYITTDEALATETRQYKHCVCCRKEIYF
jgi:hypothetical protein